MFDYGWTRGIGRAAAVAFARKGAKVVVSGRRDETGQALVKELRSFGSEAEFINADVRKEDDVRALVDKTVARFGRLDVAVNNAGTEGQVGPITDQTAESYAATFDQRPRCDPQDVIHLWVSRNEPPLIKPRIGVVFAYHDGLVSMRKEKARPLRWSHHLATT